MYVNFFTNDADPFLKPLPCNVKVVLEHRCTWHKILKKPLLSFSTLYEMTTQYCLPILTLDLPIRSCKMPAKPSDRWTDLPELTPLRAQHGCGLVELGGRRGIIVVGGDSGGTRLSDVRYVCT